MRRIIFNFPKQFKIGLASAEGVEVKGIFDKVLVCGMGGSALPAEILKMWLSAYKIALPLYIHKNYGLPPEVDKDHLIICVSYSGDTEETLSAFKTARGKNLKIVAVSSGGKLERLCKKYKVPLAKVPQNYPPRMALGFQFAALIKILVNCGLIENGLENISALEKTLKPKRLENQGKRLAKKLRNKIPLIYASESRLPLAYIWKIKFNETAKTPAFCNYFPELNHNELSSYESYRDRVSVILLRDPADHPGIQKRMKLTAEILKKRKIPVEIIDLEGKDVLYKVFSNVLLSFLTSYYLAQEYQVDPLATKLQEEFKKKI